MTTTTPARRPSLIERLLYGPVAPYRGPQHPAVVTGAPVRSSWIFDSHVVTESSARASGGKQTLILPQTASLSWDENEARGIDATMRSWQGQTPRERKETLLAIYLSIPWVSACVDVIAKRITSGGYVIEEVEEGTGDEAHRQLLEDFLLRINPEWDFLQLVRSCIIDEGIYGESYVELTEKDGAPWQLFKVDCLTMSYTATRSGQITDYVQQLESDSEVNHLPPESILRWWYPNPRAQLDPFSPMERATDAIMLYKKMVNWMITFFQKGAKYPYYYKFTGDQDEAERFRVWMTQNNTGEKNAQTPPILYNGSEIVPLGKGSIDLDFEQGRTVCRTEILSAYHVPPAVVGLIESGNIGGGTGEDQEKSFQYNVCDPVKQAYFEKFNDRITKRGFGISDYRISTRYADYRNDQALATVQDTRIRNGSITINEARQEMGKKPYANGGDVAIVVTTKEVDPVPRLDDLADEQAATAQATLQTAQAAADLAQTKAKQAKKPPRPVPAALVQHVQPSAQLAQPAQPATTGGTGGTPDAQAPQGHTPPSGVPPASAGKQEAQQFLEVRESRLFPSEDTHDAHALDRAALYHANRPVRASQSADSPLRTGTTTTEADNDNDNDQASHQPRLTLAEALLVFFAAIRAAGLSGMTQLATAVAAFTISQSQQDDLIHHLAEAYLAAQLFGYGRTVQLAGLTLPAPADFTMDEATAWATGQSSGIIATFQKLLASLLGSLDPTMPETDAKAAITDWFTHFTDYKVQQITNVTWGQGQHAGTVEGVQDILDAQTQQAQDDALVPGGTPGAGDDVQVPNVRIRVVPSHSSGDFCQDYAGNDYSLGEALSLPTFPAHPNCIHSIEAYIAAPAEESDNTEEENI